jgi:hypothetical protein
MDIEGGLLSFGLEQSQAPFREIAITQKVLPT